MIPIVEYIKRYSDRLDCQRFSVMCHAGDVREILVVLSGQMDETAVGAWIERWRHWSRHGATNA